MFVLAAAFSAAAEPAEIDRFRETMLQSHNELRARHHAPALVADRTLNKYAQDWAEQLAASGKFTHSRGPYGENLAYESSSAPIDTRSAGENAAAGWARESSHYRFGSDFSPATGHFTQMIWVSSVRLGCGFARRTHASMNMVYIVCSYDPPGNISGRFRENVLREVAVERLLQSPAVTVRDVGCQGACPHKSAEEWVSATELVFPYRGVYVHHLGSDQAVAEANQVLFFNAAEGYRVSHPVPGGDACLSLAISEPLLRELAPPALIRDGARLAFRPRRLRIDARAQALVALLRHSLRQRIAEPLEAESLALTLVQRALGPRTTHAAGASAGRQRLVDRAKLVLASDPARRWTLAEIAAELRGSPVYLTQVFQQVEGLPLYRYQLRLRLARALHLLDQYDDLTALSLDLGFSSHSHFSAAFRQAYGRSPSEFRQLALNR